MKLDCETKCQKPTHPSLVREYRMLGCKDVMRILNVGESFAYRIIKQLNHELKRDGYIVINGRVPEAKFKERFYCVSTPSKN
jgi:hypothetical protein